MWKLSINIDKININAKAEDAKATVEGTGEKTVEIGENVSVGHAAVLHGCEIDDNVLIGMNATVLNGSYINKNSIVGAFVIAVLISMGRFSGSIPKFNKVE